eukprot:6212973-Pleurochrysis_carterae.AAC.4
MSLYLSFCDSLLLTLLDLVPLTRHPVRLSRRARTQPQAHACVRACVLRRVCMRSLYLHRSTKVRKQVIFSIAGLLPECLHALPVSLALCASHLSSLPRCPAMSNSHMVEATGTQTRRYED